MMRRSTIISSLFSFLLIILSLAGCKEALTDKNNQKNNVFLQEKFDHSLIIPVTINHKIYHFLVDTGASFTIIDAALAKEITQQVPFSTLPILYKETAAKITTVHSELQGENMTFLKPVPLSIGHETITDSDLWLAIDLNLISQAMGSKIDGILGIDVFRKFNWVVNNKNHTISVQKNAPLVSDFTDCVGYSDSYNDHPLISLQYQNSNYINTHLDTGAETTLMGGEFIDYIKNQENALIPIKGNAPGVDASGFVNAQDYILIGLSFMNYPLNEIRVTKTPNQYAVGMDFLSRFDRYAFMPSKMLFCYDVTSLAKTNQYPVRLIAIRYYENQIQIFYNDNYSIDAMNLKNGDIIKQINGKTYSPEEIDKVRRLLALAPKGKLNLIIHRQGHPIKLTL